MFTDQLGTDNSQLSNEQLGIGTFYAGFVIPHSVSQSLTLSQTVAVEKTLSFNLSQSLTLSQNSAHPIDEDVNQSLTLDQSVDELKYHIVGNVQPLVLSQLLSGSLDAVRDVHQGLAPTNSATRTIRKVLAFTQTPTISQTAIGLASKHTHTELVIDQDAEYTYSKGARNNLEITQIVSVSITSNRHLFTNLIAFQILSYNAQLNETVTQPLTITSVALAQNTKPAHNNLVLSQTVDFTNSKGTYTTLPIAQAVVLSRSVGQHVNQTSSLHHTIGVQKSKAVHAQSVAGFIQFAKATRVLTVTASTALTLSQELVQQYFDESVDQSLTLDQSATAQKIVTESIIQSLTPSQAVAVSTTIKRSLSNNLVFLTSTQKYTGISDHPYVTVPDVQVVKVKLITILQQGSSVIVLPSAEFNDKEALTSRINVKRAMDGTRRLYGRLSPTAKLNYTFIIDRQKALELRDFILLNNSKMITMTNWKGEIWAVLLTNNPFSFSEDSFWDDPGGNKCSITLELEGVRLN